MSHHQPTHTADPSTIDRRTIDRHTIDRRTFLSAAGAGTLALLAGHLAANTPSARAQTATTRPATQPANLPNIVVIFADDMGYGDIHAYDPDHARFPTPCVDQLAKDGMRFTDAHTTSSVCSPSRYGLLTGRYHWRAGIRAALPMWAKPALPPDRLTVQQLLHDHGYHTACIGKWHLGWNWPRKDGEIDFTQPITGGPIDHGFDYYFGVDVPNYPPFTFIENDRVTVQPTEHQELIKDMIVNHEGPRAPGWKFDQILPTLVHKGQDYIQQRAAANQPFFLYFPLTSPHYPIAPSAEFRGKSGINPLADFMMETDATVCAISDALERAGISDNTILLFLTDNGHDPVPGLEPFEKAHHRVSGPYRGTKFNIAEGGHRVPFVIRWPRVIPKGTVCDQTICTTDLLATCAQIVGATLPPDAGEDSTSILPLLRGHDNNYQHPGVISHAPNNAFSIRSGDYKLIFLPATKDAPAYRRLYNLADDPDEKHDLAPQQPQRVQQMEDLMRKYVDKGRSTPGPAQPNDVEVKVPTL